MIVLSLAACGRRAFPEPPLTAAELAAQRETEQRREARALAEDDDADAVSTGPGLSPAPGTRRRGRSYSIPQEPFILDPLL
jgi:hypothetical protein